MLGTNLHCKDMCGLSKIQILVGVLYFTSHSMQKAHEFTSR